MVMTASAMATIPGWMMPMTWTLALLEGPAPGSPVVCLMLAGCLWARYATLEWLSEVVVTIGSGA